MRRLCLWPNKSEVVCFLLSVISCSFIGSFLLLSWLEECTGKVKAVYPSVCSLRKISLTTFHDEPSLIQFKGNSLSHDAVSDRTEMGGKSHLDQEESL